MPEGSRRLPEAAAKHYQPKHQIRIVTATSLFDGHDAAINIMRRLLQQGGAEVIHLGHNRSVDEVVTAAIQEDVQAIAVSSYQGGHVEYFKYMVDLLRQRGAAHVKVFGGGGGVIVAREIRELQDYGVERIYSPEDGQNLGLKGMIEDMIERCDFDPLTLGMEGLPRLITAAENGKLAPAALAEARAKAAEAQVPVLGTTGTGGAGKSSLTDELVRRFRLDDPAKKIAIIAIDPSKKKTGGALLGDRIRMNALGGPVFMRSLATRSSASEVPDSVPVIIDLCKAAGFELIIVETPGIGQGDSAVSEIADLAMYVMTPEFGAASQLEKIDMLDHADLVAINKFDRKGGLDALRDVRKQMQRNREAFGVDAATMPVFGSVASRFNDDGVTALYHGLLEALAAKGFKTGESRLPKSKERFSSASTAVVPAARVRYLAEIAESVRSYLARSDAQAELAREVQQLAEAARLLKQAGKSGEDAEALSASRAEHL
ncbi:MAG TPA: cobalamin-dependent protein, partial [Magnetospirillaceae bacterium]|nr:cobalamin-dependent protein [Magnetospirillaceae bacterium]